MLPDTMGILIAKCLVMVVCRCVQTHSRGADSRGRAIRPIHRATGGVSNTRSLRPSHALSSRRLCQRQSTIRVLPTHSPQTLPAINPLKPCSQPQYALGVTMVLSDCALARLKGSSCVPTYRHDGTSQASHQPSAFRCDTYNATRLRRGL
jgi:hypothetical protein